MSNHAKIKHLPVFPLNTVVFVNGILQLQIFEQRYLSMIKSCMKNQHGFVTALIRHGREVNDTPEIYHTGTYVDIIDWDSLENNLLSITVKGQQRVHIHPIQTHDDNLLSADVDYLDNLTMEANAIVDEDLLSLLKALHKHPFIANKYPDIDYSSSTDIAYKLCELLPIPNTDKQMLLEANQTRVVVDQLKTLITQLES